ncbi:MAG: glycosyltransferase [Chloroflexota bacterium]
MPRQKRLAVVVQRYGLEVNGGAEQHARWFAEQMTTTDEVHVLTTCAVDYLTWADFYEAGESDLNGVRVHRFPVDQPRDWSKEHRQTEKLLKYKQTLFDQIRWIKDQGPYSTALLQWIITHRDDFDRFVFFTFHYASTYFGLQLVADKAFLVPTAHEDPFLELPSYRPVFHLPRGIAFNTTSEQELVHRTVHNEQVPYRIAGMGVEVPDDISAERFRQTTGIQDNFLLYVGRIDESKNVPQLIDFFRRYRRETAVDGAQPLKLVLLGKANMPIPKDPDIIALGFVPDQVKFDAIRAADVVILPSLYESLSMITLEAWSIQTPMLVNGNCDVVKRLTKESNGGLYYYTYDEFAVALTTLLASADLRSTLGKQGRRFVDTHYRPDIVIAKYRDLLENGTNPVNLSDTPL